MINPNHEFDEEVVQFLILSNFLEAKELLILSGDQCGTDAVKEGN